LKSVTTFKVLLVLVVTGKNDSTNVKSLANNERHNKRHDEHYDRHDVHW
jgi:hypothetical protein